MLRKLLLCAAAFVAVHLTAFAATDANLTGHVIDGETGEHIPFCLVKILNTPTATLTDASGHYTLRDLTPGTYVIEASFTGYKPATQTVELATGKTVEANLTLHPDAFMLEQVVVTSSKSETKRRESPSLISVVTGKTFELAGACSLADGLNFQPGVRVENDCQNCGFTQVRINGLDGHYSQILMNSRPVFSALTGVYGLEQIPANMIERVEVMRGGGSALFGSSAIGGTINIITKDPMVNTARVSHTLQSIGISGALDNNTTFNASVVSDNSRTGIFVYGQSRNRDGYDHNSDGFTDVAALSSQTVGARAFLRPSDISRLTVEYHNTHEYRRGGDHLDLPPHQAQIAEQTDHNIHAAEATLDLWPRGHRDHVAVFAATQVTDRNSYYGSGYDLNAYGRTTDLVATAGSQWTHPIDHFLFMPAELLGGVEYSHNRLHDVTVGYDHDVLQRINIYSAYLQNEWRKSQWGFLAGARIDKHTLIANPVFSPRANLRYNPSDRVNFRLSYSTGFRSPQAFDEDFHVAVVGGERVVTVLDPQLRPERSQSLSASADFYGRVGNAQFNILVEGFYTNLSDVFVLRQLPATDAAGNAVLERTNGSGATVAGLNLEAKAYLQGGLDLQSGITWQRSRYKQPEVWSDNPDVPSVARMFRTPDLYGYLTASYPLTRSLRASTTATYTGPMLVQHLAGSGTDVDTAVTTRPFFDASLRLTYSFKILGNTSAELWTSLGNIFNAYQDDLDIGPDRDSGYIYGPALPRSLSLGLALSF